jgi:hypothetical protein
MQSLLPLFRAAHFQRRKRRTQLSRMRLRGRAETHVRRLHPAPGDTHRLGRLQGPGLQAHGRVTDLKYSSGPRKKIKARGALIFCGEKIWVDGLSVRRQVIIFKPALGIVEIKNITEKLVTP